MSIKGLQQISPSATLNIIPFEDNCRAVVRRGVYYKYRPQSKLLIITVCYKHIIGHSNFMPHFEARGMVHLRDDDGPDFYPFYHDILIEGSHMKLYNITTGRVRLSYSR
jgi:hypothetical protein